MIQKCCDSQFSCLQIQIIFQLHRLLLVSQAGHYFELTAVHWVDYRRELQSCQRISRLVDSMQEVPLSLFLFFVGPLLY